MDSILKHIYFVPKSMVEAHILRDSAKEAKNWDLEHIYFDYVLAYAQGRSEKCFADMNG